MALTTKALRDMLVNAPSHLEVVVAVDVGGTTIFQEAACAAIVVDGQDRKLVIGHTSKFICEVKR
jgi:hypothetical protein